MSVTLTALAEFPLVKPGDDLPALIEAALRLNEQRPRNGDILVLAQKVVSKAEGRQINLSDITPSPRAMTLAKETQKDPRLLELILSQSKEIIRHRKDVLIVESHLGLIHANAGIDQSNLEGSDEALLLPVDPDQSAHKIKEHLDAKFDVDVGVIINDSTGRPWRLGTVGIAIGCAGVATLDDLRGTSDLSGRPLEITEVGTADQIAAAASLVQGQAGEGTPVVLVSGLQAKGDGTARDLLRPAEMDLFR